MTPLFHLRQLNKGGGQPLPAPRASTPPPTETQNEVVQAKRDSRRNAARRKGMQATILAGETGGYQGGADVQTGGQTTLLGGGV